MALSLLSHVGASVVSLLSGDGVGRGVGELPRDTTAGWGRVELHRGIPPRQRGVPLQPTPRSRELSRKGSVDDFASQTAERADRLVRTLSLGPILTVRDFIIFVARILLSPYNSLARTALSNFFDAGQPGCPLTLLQVEPTENSFPTPSSMRCT